MKNTLIKGCLLLGILMLIAGSGLQAATPYIYPSGYEEVNCTAARTVFTLWAPLAGKVRVNFYASGRGGQKTGETFLKKQDGLWKGVVNSDLRGKFATFQIEYKGDWLSETPGIRAIATGVNGQRTALLEWSKTEPQDWKKDERPDYGSFADILLYELHLRDFTQGKQSGTVNKGKYLSLTETGSTNSNSFSTGLDHITDLGVSHVILMPVFDFDTDDEARPKDMPHYWNYQPQNYFLPEGSYSTRPFDPVSRIVEFRQMIMAFHKAGIRVVMDVSFDHTANAALSAFTLTQPGKFYRMKANGSYSSASGYGNELATEQLFVRNYMLDVLRFWIREYHVDGFRFDEMGVMDAESVRTIFETIRAENPSIYICGDPATCGESTQLPSTRALAVNNRLYPRMPFFDHAWRSALRGVSSDSTDGGFLGGKTVKESLLRYGFAGGIRHPQVVQGGSLGSGIPFTTQPFELIVSLSSHDGFKLFDQINSSMQRKETAIHLRKRSMLAGAVLLTSQGTPCIHGGDELMNSMNGYAGSVQTPDSLSRIDWRNKTYNNDVYEYFRGLIELRKLHPAFRMGQAEAVMNRMQFLEAPVRNVVAFQLLNNANGDSWKTILVIHNANEQNVEMSVSQGKWTVVVADGEINPEGLSRFEGSKVLVAPLSTTILCKN